MAVSLTPANSHLYCVGTQLPNTANPFTINVWINAVWNGGSRLSFVGLYNSTPPTGAPTNGAGLQIGTDGGGDVSCWTYGGTVRVTSTGMTAFNNTWVMMTYVYEGGNVHRIYRNGVLLASNTVAVTTAQMTQVFINGYPPTGNANETSNFSIDSYTSYNKALTADEILSLYNNQGARGGNVYQMACRYEFDEGVAGSAATAVIDVSGGGQTLQHTGAANTTTYTYSGVANSNTRPVQ